MKRLYSEDVELYIKNLEELRGYIINHIKGCYTLNGSKNVKKPTIKHIEDMQRALVENESIKSINREIESLMSTSPYKIIIEEDDGDIIY